MLSDPEQAQAVRRGAGDGPRRRPVHLGWPGRRRGRLRRRVQQPVRRWRWRWRERPVHHDRRARVLPAAPTSRTSSRCSVPGRRPGRVRAPGFRAPRGARRGEDLTADVTLTFRQAVEGAQLSLRVDDPMSGVRTVNARIPGRGQGRSEGAVAWPWPAGRVRCRRRRPRRHCARRAALGVHPPTTTTCGSRCRSRSRRLRSGAQVEVPTLDGPPVRVKVPAGTPSGRTLRVKGHGVRTAKGVGDLLVTVQVVVPQRLDSSGSRGAGEIRRRHRRRGPAGRPGGQVPPGRRGRRSCPVSG